MNRSVKESRFATAGRHADQNDILLNKSGAATLFHAFGLWVSVVFTFTLLSTQVDQIKTNNNLLESFGSWVGSIAPDNSINNANFYILMPVYAPSASFVLSVSTGGTNGNIGISFPTQPGYGYLAEYETNLVDAVWPPLGNVISGDGTIHSLIDLTDADTDFSGCKSSEPLANNKSIGWFRCFYLRTTGC